MKYETIKFKGNYRERQFEANKLKTICYIEQHFNANVNDKPGNLDNPTLVITGTRPSKTTIKMAEIYISKICKAFGTKPAGQKGILIGPDRGKNNVEYANMPSILLEPLYASDVDHANILRSEIGQLALAQIIVETVTEVFPNGGLVGLSVGHLYKKTSPGDTGAPLHGGGTEGAIADKVIDKAIELFSLIV